MPRSAILFFFDFRDGWTLTDLSGEIETRGLIDKSFDGFVKTSDEDLSARCDVVGLSTDEVVGLSTDDSLHIALLSSVDDASPESLERRDRTSSRSVVGLCAEQLVRRRLTAGEELAHHTSAAAAANDQQQSTHILLASICAVFL